jgi:hypothetical protein
MQARDGVQCLCGSGVFRAEPGEFADAVEAIPHRAAVDTESGQVRHIGIRGTATRAGLAPLHAGQGPRQVQALAQVTSRPRPGRP